MQDGDNATEAEVESEPAEADLDEVEAALLKLSEEAAVVKESNPRPQEDYLKPARDKLIAVIQVRCLPVAQSAPPTCTAHITHI